MNKPLNTLSSVIREMWNYLRTLCINAWKSAKCVGGAFLRVFVDRRTGFVYYDTERERIKLYGTRFMKRPYGNAERWELVRLPWAD